MQSLKHPEPEYRYIGIYVIAVRGKPFQNELLHILAKDQHCDVQQAARFALIALAKKKSMKHIDFGPLPGASQEQVEEAIQEWQRWWNPSKK
jgi:redox-sensitive bicupin YhaK (pirin superfamily)